jgi:hypothetical protein
MMMMMLRAVREWTWDWWWRLCAALAIAFHGAVETTRVVKLQKEVDSSEQH